jgi:tRNA(Arg) A34 adenosine deaminase TadA
MKNEVKFMQMFEMKTDVDFIKRCGILAEDAAAKGESPVGSLITRNGEVVCEAIEASKNKNDIICHAELEAIRLAVKKLQQTICLHAFFIQHTSLALCVLMR